MATIVKHNYKNKDDFWKAVSDVITAEKKRLSPSGYHKFYGKVIFEDRRIENFTTFKAILSTIAKYYKNIESVEIKFNPSPCGRKPRPW